MTQAKLTLTHEKGATDQYPAVITNGLSRFIYQAYPAHPDWEYVRASSNPFSIKNQTTVYVLNVFKHGRLIGSIGQDPYPRVDEALVLRSPRIHVGRRDKCIKTRTIKTAIAAAKKYFSVQSVEMALAEVREKAEGTLRIAAYHAQREYHTVDAMLNHDRRAFIDKHWDEFVSFLDTPNVLEAANTIGGLENTLERLVAMEFQFTNFGGVAVHIENGVYTMMHGARIKVFTRDQVSEDLLYKIGMIKLSSIGDVTTNIGYKAESNLFHLYVGDGFNLE